MITITTTNSLITMSEKEMTIIELMTKIMTKEITNKDQMRKKKEKNRIDKAEIETYNQIIKIKKTIKIGNGYSSKSSQKEN